jgi:transposase
VEVVTRDGSGAYGEAVRSALPDAVQCGDRWHLWHLLGAAAAKEVAAHSACWAEGAPLPEGKRAETTRERWQQVHDLRSKGAGLLDCSRRLGLALNTVKRYDRADAPERLRRAARYRSTLVDPYRDYLRERRAEEPGVPVQQLLREIREPGYPGSSNLLVRYLNQGRADAERPHIALRKASQILLTRPDNLTDGQRKTAARLASACPEMEALASLIRSFAAMLTPAPGNQDKLQQWITDARAADLPDLHSFTRGLDLDVTAATAAVTLPHHNGRTEGVNNKTILWNQNCQIGAAWAWRISTIGRMVALAGRSSCRGVGPAGVGMSASRSSSLSRAALPSSTAACSSSVSGIIARIFCRFSFASRSWALLESFGV